MWFKKKEKKNEQNKTEEAKNNKTAKKKVEQTEKSKKAEAEKPKKAVYRVIFSKENNVWQIKKDGARRVIDSKVTKEEALERVKQLSESQEIKFVVHKKDGKFQKKSNLR